MTQYLENMKTGDTILFQGPSGRLFYHGSGKFAFKPYKTSELDNKLVHHLGMIAGGTGVTPLLQLIRCITKKPSDKTRMSLVCANQTQEEILVRKELEEVDRTHPKQFNLWYTLDRPPVAPAHGLDSRRTRVHLSQGGVHPRRCLQQTDTSQGLRAPAVSLGSGETLEMEMVLKIHTGNSQRGLQESWTHHTLHHKWSTHVGDALQPSLGSTGGHGPASHRSRLRPSDVPLQAASDKTVITSPQSWERPGGSRSAAGPG
ncbi:NADH-cytochrome b5 reductase 3 [Monodon monoceros]|uniref:NADH-cytochrome b5 reductase 3 n=1 Tax=Monodon monoceros TaxID=40151 RepID=UPI0010F9DEB1|nr:NADH-cytochrome b5 reductase 3 [Monodon monoceros]